MPSAPTSSSARAGSPACTPYVTANLRSLPARELHQWIEYCNSPEESTSLADLRAAGGEPGPFRVRFWGVGNESWGRGGNFTPEEYATEYRRFTAWVPRYGVDLAFVGSGPNSGDLGWSRRFFARLVEKGEGELGGLWGWGLHHYSWNASRRRTTDWFDGKGDAMGVGVASPFRVCFRRLAVSPAPAQPGRGGECRYDPAPLGNT